ncbi:MAG: DUF4173 domain-containing protein [Bacteroidetes bacterium]|nr:DUF4173 domain-containing protein [Bacteroidota bacterium]
MKKNDWATLLATTAFSFLFYHQYPGLNFLVLTLLIIILMLASNPAHIKKRKWVFFSALTILSSIFVLMYGSSLAILATIISLLLLSSYSISDRSSVIINLMQSLYSVFSSFVFITKNITTKNKTENGKKSILSIFLTFVVPVIIAFIFLIIYKSANPLFANYTEKINLDFISLEWVLFTFVGFLIVYGVFYHKRIEPIDQWENKLPLILSKSENSKNLNKWDEKKAVTVLFVLLNVMLIFINVLDVNYLYLGDGMPKGITHKEFVHNGVGMLILSILLAITTILYFFRGNLNFDKNNKLVRILVYVWIGQNLIMVVSTGLRNHMYVDEALFTYKRIGVYYWLLLASIGLITTFIKIYKTRSAWYLFKSNSLFAYIILVLSAAIDWDKYISDQNLSRIKYIASLDKKYLISLSETNLAQLYTIKNDKDFNTDSLYHFEYSYGYQNARWLDYKLYRFFENNAKLDWKSFNYRKQRVLSEIKDLNNKELITSLDLSSSCIYSLKPIFSIFNIKELILKNGRLASLNDLNNFPKLQKLDLEGNYLLSLDSLPLLKDLTHLSVANNPISELNHLDNTKHLQVLDVSNTNLKHINDISFLKELKELLLNGNKINDLTPLEFFPKLESLSAINIQTYPDKIPELRSLKYLNISGSPALQNLLKLKAPINIEHLNLNSNSLKNIDVLFEATNNKNITTIKFKKLKELHLESNDLYSINKINLLTSVETLNLTNNKIRYIASMAALKDLKRLYINNNDLRDIHFLDSLVQIKELNIANNQSIRDFKTFKKLPNLLSLNLSNTDFNDLLDLSALTLEELHLEGCRIKSFEGIKEFKQLKTLYVSHLEQKDIAQFKSLKLKILKVSSTNTALILKLKKILPNTEVIEIY